jgi:hypothetical protein
VLINLDSHLRMDDKMAQEFAAVLKIVLDNHPKLQVLWKFKTSSGFHVKTVINGVGSSASDEKSGGGSLGGGLGKDVLDAISNGIASGRVRVVDWLSVEPLAVLQSGHVTCFVHHGGSNSFHDALRYAYLSKF